MPASAHGTPAVKPAAKPRSMRRTTGAAGAAGKLNMQFDALKSRCAMPDPCKPCSACGMQNKGQQSDAIQLRSPAVINPLADA